jgi:hypothetical protein
VRARDLIALGGVSGLFAPGVVPADEADASASDTGTAMHGSFDNGEDLTRPRNQFQVRQR